MNIIVCSAEMYFLPYPPPIGMFEAQKVCRHDKFWKEWSQHQNKCKSQIGQDQVSGGVSVLCWQTGVISDQLRVSLYMVMSQNVI